ncbi:MAG: ArsR family transcriptional regulator [Promethearchaeota archaeon]|nr:MAG: ArsR family transcriptional regulator [Candidatus Lokiarchaeota archaeon]
MSVEERENWFKFEENFGSKARIKILKILALNIEQSISQIIKDTNLNHTCVRKHLNYLKALNLVQEKTFGRIKIFRYKTENIKAKSLKNFIEIWEK